MSFRSLMPSLWADDSNKDVFQNLHSEVDRVFRHFQSPSTLGLGAGASDGELGTFIPRINVAETEKKYEINVELPGVEKDDVEVTVANKILTIEGHKKTESEKTEKDYRIVERSEGRFKRMIPLGFDLAEEKVDAQCKDGVLSISIDKPAELSKNARKIEVKSSEPA